MKLLTKTSLVYLICTAVVFVAGGLVFYINLRNIVDEESEEKLLAQKELFLEFVDRHDSLPPLSYENYGIDRIAPVLSPVEQHFRDTVFYSRAEDEQLPFRMLVFPVSLQGKNYSVTISQPLFESDDLTETILISFSITAAVLLVITLLVNSLVSRTIWKPFLRTIALLREYRAGKESELQLSRTGTYEFSQLNEALNKMSARIAADYRNLKSFTENASHEMQTPLSVILNTSELLLQHEGLDEKQAAQLQRIGDAARRLSRLNQTLLLIAKIENGQFVPGEKVNFRKIIETRLEALSDLAVHQELHIEKNIESDFLAFIHPALAESLTGNLLSNAIRHTEKGGTIRLHMHTNGFSICNPGKPLQAPEKIFERFYKENPGSESTGLGLALVKQIAGANGLAIHYLYKNGEHCFDLQNPSRIDS